MGLQRFRSALFRDRAEHENAHERLAEHENAHERLAEHENAHERLAEHENAHERLAEQENPHERLAFAVLWARPNEPRSDASSIGR